MIGYRFQVGPAYPFQGGIALRRQGAGGSFEATVEKVPTASSSFRFALGVDSQDKVHLIVADDTDKLYHLYVALPQGSQGSQLCQRASTEARIW